MQVGNDIDDTLIQSIRSKGENTVDKWVRKLTKAERCMGTQ